MQLERKRQALEQEGIGVAALTYDSAEILENFAERTGIHYPLLSDPGSKVIRAFGILNDTLDPSHQFYGIPHPGFYLIDPEGVVKSKFFEQKYADRYTAGEILVRELGVDAGARRVEKETDHLTLTSWASDEIVRGGNRFTLALDVDLKPKMHVYAPGVGGGYYAVEWTMEEVAGLTNFDPAYPPSEILHLPAINERVPVYQGAFRVVRDIMIGQPKQLGHLLDEEGQLVIKGSFRYQACDDKVCYFPQTVPVEWTLPLEDHDRTRAPEELRRKTAGGE